MKNFQKDIAFDFNTNIMNLKQILNQTPDTRIELINKEEHMIADALASFGRTHLGLSLFVQGQDGPRWLEEICSHFNLSF